MHKSRLIHLILSLAMLVSIASGLIIGQTLVFAQDTTTTTTTPTPTPNEPPSLSMTTDISSYSDNSGSTFNFDLSLKYTGKERRTVNLSVTGPQGWTTNLTYLSKQVSSLDMAADQYGADSKTISVSMSNNAGTLPDPGSYQATVKATAGDLNASQTVTAIVKAKYSMYTAVDSGLLSTNAVAGKDNVFTFKVVNDGSTALENIKLSSTGPTAWKVTFSPDKIDSLGAGQTEQVQATINPPADKTVAGDYNVILTASGQTSSTLTVRVTVLTPSIWGWVSIIIVAIVIIGLVVLFWRLGRR